MTRRAKGEGTLWKDDRGRWIGQADAGLHPTSGKRRRVKLTGQPGESKADVARRLGERIKTMTAVGVPQTVGEMCEQWLIRSAPKRKSAKSLATDRRLVKLHVYPRFANTKITTLTAEDVEQWCDALLKKLARTTVVKVKGQLAMAFDFAIARRHTTWNPARLAELPPSAKPRREGRALTGPEARALLNVSDDHRYGAWVILGLTLGLRPGEISGLTWDAVDLDAGTVVIHQSMTWLGEVPTLKPSTKTGRVRTLDLPPRALDALRWHRKRQAEEKLYLGDRWPLQWQSLVFVTSNGTPVSPSSMRRMISKMAGAAEIAGKVTPYDLRHSATSLLSASGVPAELLADLLGHTSTRMVERFYRHPVTPTISVAADNIDQALGL